MIFISMDNINELIAKLLGRIRLTKPRMFGLDSQDIVVVISPSMKIFGMRSKPEKTPKLFPI